VFSKLSFHGALLAALCVPAVTMAQRGGRGGRGGGADTALSTDVSWRNIGPNASGRMVAVAGSTARPDEYYFGTTGGGVWKTTDGGKTAVPVTDKYFGGTIGAIAVEEKNPDVVWVGGGEYPIRGNVSYGEGVWKSTDAGEHWTEITHNPGLPNGLIGNVGMSLSPAKPNRIWALIENEPGGGVYRSDDAGATWTLLNQSRDLRQRAWYFGRVFADPKDTNTVYSLNVGTFVSHDGGKTFASTTWRGGSDHHDMWIAPDNPQRFAVAYDQGIGFTTDGGPNMVRTATPTGQFYHVHLLNKVPFDVCGAKQDAGSQCGPERQPQGFGGRGGGGRGGAPAAPASPYSEFYGAAGGESGYMASDPSDPNVTFGGNYSGVIDMQNRATGERGRLDPWPLNPMGHDAKDSKYRFQWTFPIMNSPHDPNVLYVGSNVVFKSSDKGKSWQIISPDLTKHDPATLGASGGPITKDQTSIEYYATVFALQESPITPGLIWAGSDDGLIHVTRDGGKTWKNVTPKGLPAWTRISIIDPSPHNPGTAWVAANRYQLDDYAPYLYKTTDYGATWTRINEGIPVGEYTRSIREDLVKPGLLYAATERSMWLSRDAGAHWESLKKNLPPVPVHDIALRDDDMAIATHGRAFWVMENLSLLRQEPEATAAIASGKDFLYTPAPAYRAGGVTVEYRLAKGDSPVTIEFLDPAGKLIRKVSSTDTVVAPSGRGGRGGAAPQRVTNRAGLNHYTWNLQYPDATTFQGMIFWQGSTSGPFAAPGTYTVRVTDGSAAPISEKFVVRKDPQSKATLADLAEQFRFGLQIRDSVTAANDAIRTIRNVRRQLEARAASMSGNASFGAMAKAFEDQLGNVEDSIYQTKNQSGEDPLNFPVRINNQLAALLGFVTAGERRPPKQSYDVFGVLAPKFQTEDSRYKRIMDTNLTKINAALKAAGQPVIVPSTDEPPAPKKGEISTNDEQDPE
jgi:photosystem II stability/assembly factor-like uncharacterized protein